MLLELSDALAAMTVMALPGTVIITGPLSLLLLLLYRPAVRRAMRRRATDAPTVASVAGTDSLSPPSPATLLLEMDARPTHRGGEQVRREVASVAPKRRPGGGSGARALSGHCVRWCGVRDEQECTTTTSRGAGKSAPSRASGVAPRLLPTVQG